MSPSSASSVIAASPCLGPFPRQRDRPVGSGQPVCGSPDGFKTLVGFMWGRPSSVVLQLSRVAELFDVDLLDDDDPFGSTSKPPTCLSIRTLASMTCTRC